MDEKEEFDDIKVEAKHLNDDWKLEKATEIKTRLLSLIKHANPDDPNNYTIKLTNKVKRNIKQIFKGELQKGYNEIYFNNDDLSHGSYYIYVKGQNNKIKFAGKIIK